jgi:hypothetical protein
MPQTKFVLSKSLKLGLKPIVVINKIDKIDKEGRQAHRVIDQIFDLFVKLDASDEQLDFPVVYCISREGIAKYRIDDESKDLTPLFQTYFSLTLSILDQVGIRFSQCHNSSTWVLLALGTGFHGFTLRTSPYVAVRWTSPGSASAVQIYQFVQFLPEGRIGVEEVCETFLAECLL